MDGSEVRDNGIPNALVDYWNKKNGLSIDSMPGLKLADDLTTALVPPFNLQDFQHTKDKLDDDRKVTTDTVQITKANLRLLLVSIFVLGMVAMYGFQSTSRRLVAI